MIDIDELTVDESLELLEGITKKLNKIKKAGAQNFGDPKMGDMVSQGQKEINRNPKPGFGGTTKRRSEHRRKRGVKKAQESLLNFIQQAVSEANKANKAKKRNYEGKSGADIMSKEKLGIHSLPAGTKKRAFDGMIKSDAKGGGTKNRIHHEAGRRAVHRQKARESLFGTIHNMITEEQADDIEQAGGSPEVFRATRKAKLAQRGVRKSKHISRKDALGKMGGRYKKDGTQADKHTKSGGEKNFSDDTKKTSGIPLNPKGKPKKGRSRGDKADVRGKTVNTSRSTGEEGRKADANADAFSDLVGNLSKNKR